MFKKFKLPSAFDFDALLRLTVNIYAPWSIQSKKFDMHFAFYPAPHLSLSAGLTIPFLFCIYITLGAKMDWWERRFGPNLNHASFGVWFFIGSFMTSGSLKLGKWRGDFAKPFANFKERRRRST